jgi:hypothetical protein
MICTQPVINVYRDVRCQTMIAGSGAWMRWEGVAAVSRRAHTVRG